MRGGVRKRLHPSSHSFTSTTTDNTGHHHSSVAMIHPFPCRLARQRAKQRPTRKTRNCQSLTDATALPIYFIGISREILVPRHSDTPFDWSRGSGLEVCTTTRRNVHTHERSNPSSSAPWRANVQLVEYMFEDLP